MTPEGQLKRQICEYLEARGVFFWLHMAQKMRFKSKYARNGVADILGIWKRKFIAIEVKTPAGVVSEAQWEFLRQVIRMGGIGIVARKLEHVEQLLDSKEYSGVVEWQVPDA